MLNLVHSPVRAFALTLAVSAIVTSPLVAQIAGPIQIVPRAQLFGSGTAQFGTTLALSGDDLLVRGIGDGASVPAREFVFHRSAGAWSQQAAFDVYHYSNGDDSCSGHSTNLAIAGDLLVIGESFNGSIGKTWISQRTGTSWSTPTYIEDQNFFNFGQAVLLYQGAILVGMPDDPFEGDVGIWRKSPTAWDEVAFIQSPPPYHGAMGALLASSGTTLLVAEHDAVRVFVQGATLLSWTHQAILDPAGSAVVRAIAIDGDVAVISTGGNTSCSTSPAQVLVYERTGSSWSQTASLVAADSTPPELGSSVAVRGDTIYVGAASHPSGSATGAVYIFQHLGSGWTQTSKLLSDPPLPSQSYFGASLVTDGTTLCVGAPGTGANPGVVQVFDVMSLPPTMTYCTAKLNSQGCLPAISAIGVPGTTNPDPFTIGATNVINHKTGMVLYSIAGSATTPFQGGTLCLAAPLHRTPGQNSGGNAGPDDCSGGYAFDFNHRIQSGIDPALLPGVQVWAQYYSRDPADPFGVGLTDAVVFTIGS
jgi:hypothetical protein